MCTYKKVPYKIFALRPKIFLGKPCTHFNYTLKLIAIISFILVIYAPLTGALSLSCI